ncbi:MAG: 12-oxophytodienoate reductase [Verrucomicrobiae bacterium]|nr:12-oxophytodienoate reductase [Verrucomicrobiae bacterium]
MEALFSPIQIKNLTLRNRFVMAPMTRCRANNGVPTETMVEYYRKRAAGGLGMILTEGTLIDHPLANAYGDAPYLREDTVAGWQAINQAIREEGCFSFVQVWHCGPVARPGLAAVAVKDAGKEVVRAATEEDKHELLDIYKRSAHLAIESGFDGLELHAAHGYLLDSFLRSGQPEFVQEVVRATRSEVGSEFPIILRFSTWTVEDFEASYLKSPEELEALLLPLKEAGVDVFHPSVRRYWKPVFPDSSLSLAAWTKTISGLPTIAVGTIGLDPKDLGGDGEASLATLDQKIKSGEFDMVAIGRALLTEPDWVNKVEAQHFDDIRPWYEQSAQDVYP